MPRQPTRDYVVSMSQPKHRRRRSETPTKVRTTSLAIALVTASLLSVGLWWHWKAPSSSSSITTTPLASSTLPAHPRGSSPTALNQSLGSYLRLRSGAVELAVEDLNSGLTTTYGRNSPQVEASVVKVNILAALLASSSVANTPLTAQEQNLAQGMIEESDNNSATSLWMIAGGGAGIGTFDRRIGLTATTPSPCVVCQGFAWPGWGLTTTTPLDELKLLRIVFLDSAYLNSQSHAYELQLMESVVPSERWGVSSGVASSATVALKNGWLPLNATNSDWQINSVGWIRGDGRNYLIAIFSTGNPSEDYGIQTLNSVSALIWDHLAS